MNPSDDLNREDAKPENEKPENEKKSESRRRRSDSRKVEGKKTEPVMGAGSSDGISAHAASSGTKNDGDSASDAEAGKALAPAAVSPIDPFLAARTQYRSESKAEAAAVAPSRSFASRMLDYSAHAAIIVGLIGFAWTVSDHVIGRKAASDVTAAKSQVPGKRDDMGELRLANMKMHEEIKALKASVDAMRTASRRDTTPEQIRLLGAGLDNVKTSIGAAKAETSSALAQLQAKVDKLAPGKVQALADRVGRLERQAQGVDTAATGSIARNEPSRTEPSRTEMPRPDTTRAEPQRSNTGEAAKTAPKPPAKPASLANLEETHAAPDDGKPPVIQGWVVRDVYQGVALIEGKRGSLEVVPGVSIPGAGVVKSIERKGGGWIVTTSKGQLAYAGAAAQREQRDYRRGNNYGGGGYGRGGYPPYRYDY